MTALYSQVSSDYLSHVIDNSIDSPASYLRPLFIAARDAGCRLAFLLQGSERQVWPASEAPTIYLIGDDTETAKGPWGFNRKTLREAAQHCVAAVIVACEPIPDAYAAAAAVASGGSVLFDGKKPVNGSVMIVETQPYQEIAWKDFLEKTRPGIALLMCTTRKDADDAAIS